MSTGEPDASACPAHCPGRLLQAQLVAEVHAVQHEQVRRQRGGAGHGKQIMSACMGHVEVNLRVTHHEQWRRQRGGVGGDAACLDDAWQRPAEW